MGNNKLLFINMIKTEYKIGQKQLARRKTQHFSIVFLFLIWGSLLCFSIGQRVPGLKKVEDCCSNEVILFHVCHISTLSPALDSKPA